MCCRLPVLVEGCLCTALGYAAASEYCVLPLPQAVATCSRLTWLELAEPKEHGHRSTPEVRLCCWSGCIRKLRHLGQCIIVLHTQLHDQLDMTC